MLVIFFYYVAVPLDSRYSDIEISSDEIIIHSEIRSSSIEKHDWCKISRNSDLCSATMLNNRCLKSEIYASLQKLKIVNSFLVFFFFSLNVKIGFLFSLR
jgi:hypothetical protein